MPDPTAPPPRRVAIVGGGIAGLAAAHWLVENAPAAQWTLFESTPRLGGVLETERFDAPGGEWLVERSADNFLNRDPWATDLCQRVGIASDLLPTDPARRRALVVSRGVVRPVPPGFVLMSPWPIGPTLNSSVLSVAGKLRLACEPLVPRRRDPSDESVASFARRRLGREVFERLVQPLVGGIYTADPEKLSMRATLPQFVEQERTHGSLLRAAWRAGRQPSSIEDATESGARYGLFLAPRGGMKQLIDAVAARLPAERVKLSRPVAAIERTGAAPGWNVVDPRGDSLGRFDSVIVATPAHHAARIVRGVDTGLADELAAIEYAGASVVCLGLRADQVANPINGFGFVVPAIEKRGVLAVSFASLKFPGRAPDGGLLARAFVGGALDPQRAELDDDALVRLAADELRALVGLRGEPLWGRVVRWPRSMPQYHVGHVERVERIEARVAAIARLELAGAAYRGVGVPQCVRSGELAAQRSVAGAD
ncbi:MAG: protoporphyrinogen oxidase [Lacipirellulaceae bacterium]